MEKATKKEDIRKRSIDYNKIKKHYGEEFARLCYECFQAIMIDNPGVISTIIIENFAPNPSLAEDMSKNKNIFQEYISGLLKPETVEIVKTDKTVRELLKEAGYDFYECHNEKEIQMFKKYYAYGEELCTFDGGRLKRAHVFWIVKKDVKQIKRDNYPNPKRNDTYSTSVMSIQFNRNTHRVSIKSRYNHTVEAPDSILSNNLERIIPGLSYAFKKEYGLYNEKNTKDIDYKTILDLKYVKAEDGKLYKYNYCIDKVYYCPNNIIIDDGKIIDLNKIQLNRYLLIDHFILDKQERKIYLYDKELAKDSFIDSLEEVLKPKEDEKGRVQKPKINDSLDKKTGIRTLIIKATDNKEIIIKIDKRGRIIGYKNDIITEIDDCFLWHNKAIKELDLPNVKKIGDYFLYNNETIEVLHLPSVESIGNRFLEINKILTELIMPKLKKVGFNFLVENILLQELDLPSLEHVGDNFLMTNTRIKKINLPNIKIIANNFLRFNRYLEELYLPELEEVEAWFMSNNYLIKKIYAPKLKKVGIDFLNYNNKIKELDLPNLEEAEEGFLEHSRSIISCNIPKLKNTHIIKKIKLKVKNNLEVAKKELLIQKIKNIKLFKIIKNKIKLIRNKKTIEIKKGEKNEKTTNNRGK